MAKFIKKFFKTLFKTSMSFKNCKLNSGLNSVTPKIGRLLRSFLDHGEPLHVGQFPLSFASYGKDGRSPPRIRWSTCPQTNAKERERERTMKLDKELNAKDREGERNALSVHPLRVYVYTRLRYAHACIFRERAPRKFDRSVVGPFACSSFPNPSRIFPSFGFRLRCGRPITKKFHTTSYPSLRFVESLFRDLIFTPRNSVPEYYSRPIKASDSLVEFPPPKLNPFHFN